MNEQRTGQEEMGAMRKALLKTLKVKERVDVFASTQYRKQKHQKAITH